MDSGLEVWRVITLVLLAYMIGCFVNLIIVLLIIPRSGYGMEQGFFLPFMIPLSWLAMIIMLVGVLTNIKWWVAQKRKKGSG